jgi:hypothetical protein
VNTHTNPLKENPMTDQPANLDRDDIEARAAHLWEYVQQPDEADVLAGTDVPALIDTVRRLRTELAREQENYRAYRIGVEGAKKIAERRIADLDRALGETIDDRDRLHEVADKLACAVAPIEVIGEHSSMNCPWTNAFELITPAADVAKLRTELAEYEPLNPQQCPAGKHADWLVDSEYAHACPWCEIDRLRATPPMVCINCETPVGWVDCPTGGWWAHETHPKDGHDADPKPAATPAP